MSTKKINLRRAVDELVGETGQRKVPQGVSVFDLIMPWKSDVVEQETTDLCKDGLAKIVTPKGKLLDVCLDDHACDVQAVLMNPPWENSFAKTKNQKKISIEEFKKGF